MVQTKIDIESPHQEDLRALFTELKVSLAGMSTNDVIDYQMSVADMTAPDTTTFVARVNNEAVACGSLVRHKNGIAEIKRMYTEPKFRKHGIGKAVLRHISSLALSEGFRELVVVTGAKYDDAIAFYEKEGFERSEKILDHAPSKHSVYFKKAL
ncbi:GNAT family N-acetyltransferase [Martelella alba]|uniref:GNAT family N-acetyltransferase n=1 Tax=Martelella alba TaxID=2590451 RepID=A0A506UJW1_9HYPH|nr:GNAT family N-acetyltransferase [Martelella alba]TPW33627.1 GNAT family N-acetyltransferase [Martelella alba]